MTQEALKLALEALELAHPRFGIATEKHKQAITAIKEALREHTMREVQRLEQEIEQPKVRTGDCLLVGVCAAEGHKIAPQRTWVGLTDGEIDELHGSPMNLEHSGALKWVRIIEAKLKEKNT